MFKGLQSSNQYSGNGKGKVCSKHILTLMSKQKVLSEYFYTIQGKGQSVGDTCVRVRLPAFPYV